MIKKLITNNINNFLIQQTIKIFFQSITLYLNKFYTF